MTKGLDNVSSSFPMSSGQNGNYHGRTELGIGQHDLIKKRLEEERHRDYQDHIARKALEQSGKQNGSGDVTVPTGSVVDIGYETSQCIANQRKQLNEQRKAEYVAHLASQSVQQTGIETSQPNEGEQLNETANSTQLAEDDNLDKKKKQRDYAEALREQIAEKKRTTDRAKKREQEDDQKNMEMSRTSHNNFHYGNSNQQSNN